MNNKILGLSIFIPVVFLAVFLFSYSLSEARSGCCSSHGGVCGCGCCDGSDLSATCAPYYPECNEPEKYCGDSNCNNNETCSSCTMDCGVCKPYCGDLKCNGKETCTTCSGDCGKCPEKELEPKLESSGLLTDLQGKYDALQKINDNLKNENQNLISDNSILKTQSGSDDSFGEGVLMGALGAGGLAWYVNKKNKK